MMADVEFSGDRLEPKYELQVDGVASIYECLPVFIIGGRVRKRTG